MKPPFYVADDTTVVDSEGHFVCECHDAASSVGTQQEYDMAEKIAALLSGAA